jgi:FkbM family methyltransferase
MLNFARALTLPSAISYAKWRVRKQEEPISLRLRSGTMFELRPDSCGNNDYGVAYEVFVHDYYSIGDRFKTAPVRLVVDLGANVGFSVLHWLRAFPDCRVITLEPHPAHAAQAERNLSLNGLRERVEIIQAGAGSRARQMILSDAGSSSSLGSSACGGIEVEIVDVFPLLQGRKIDLLKIDIEGSEYEIMADPRFAELDIRAIVMEWHARENAEQDRQWCETRLRSLGFSVEEVMATSSHGMFWAVRAA